jgi:GNAT superfamily N-acetyltransferase
MPTCEFIRPAIVEQKSELEALQMRASLVWEGDREALLADPEMVEIPLRQLQIGHVLVAMDNEQLIGFAAMNLRSDGQAELDGLFVEPSHWRQGLGRRLVEAIEKVAEQAGSDTLHLIANPRAEAFYIRCGFAVTGSKTMRFGSALLLQKSIT